MSKQREAVLEALRSSEGHLRADEIFSLVREKIPNISVGTVYRNLGVLVSEGLVHRISVSGGGDVYDKTPFPHGHLICHKCSRVFDLPAQEEKSIDLTVAKLKEMGKMILSYNFTAEIVCPACYENN